MWFSPGNTAVLDALKPLAEGAGWTPQSSEGDKSDGTCLPDQLKLKMPQRFDLLSNKGMEENAEQGLTVGTEGR